jgi:hypothetical protein
MPDRRLFAGDPLQAYVHQGDHHCAHKRSDHIEPCFSEIARRHAKNGYIPVDDEELDAIAIESNHTIEIDSFVPRAQIDERYLDSPYYIAPDGQVGQDAFAVIRE